ncbi:MAG: tetratricopeptide repeat protein [Leptospiraceae bacterium]|nr:tetratricopeptide repeat protein [Leptospiraceae bacterium]
MLLILSINHVMFGQTTKQEIRITPLFLESLRLTPQEVELGYENPQNFVRNEDDWLWGNGSDVASLRNNEALNFVLQNDMERAREILQEVCEKSPQFFPARFNYGRVLLFFKEYQQALFQFSRATALVPQYWKNYYYLAKAYELAADYNAAVYHYRLAYLRNPYDLESLVALGDLLLDLNRAAEADLIYRFVLERDPGFNNALIGTGKVYLRRGRFQDALISFRAVDRSRAYKKELHFYMGEAAFYSQDYRLAAEEYEKMLGYPQDAVFNRISLYFLRQRVKMARRLSLQQAE